MKSVIFVTSSMLVFSVPFLMHASSSQQKQSTEALAQQEEVVGSASTTTASVGMLFQAPGTTSAETKNYFQIAAQQGYTTAQLHLGIRPEKKGTEEDKAYREDLFRKASLNGYDYDSD